MSSIRSKAASGESVDWLRAPTPAGYLLFMDIHLADGDSFRIFDARGGHGAGDLHDSLTDRCALEAFAVNSIDYLLSRSIQPTCSGRSTSLHAAVQGRAQRITVRACARWPRRREQTFLVHVRDKIIPLKREDIAFCYTCNEKVTAYTFAGASYPLDKTLEALQAVLPEADFFPRQPPVHRGAPRREGDFRVVRQPSFAESCARNS